MIQQLTQNHKTYSMCICTVNVRFVSQDKRADIASLRENTGHRNTSVFQSVCGSANFSGRISKYEKDLRSSVKSG